MQISVKDGKIKHFLQFFPPFLKKNTLKNREKMFFCVWGGDGGCVLNERVVWWRVGFRVNNGYKPNLFL